MIAALRRTPTWVMLAVLALVATAAAVAPPVLTSDAAVACPATTLTRTGPQATAVNQANPGGTWDLRGAVWTNSPDPVVYPIQSDSWTAGCIIGGYVDGNTPDGLTREQTYGSTAYDDAEGVRVNVTAGSWLNVTDTRVEDVEDAFDPNGGSVSSTTYLTHVRTSDRIYDDCIENEQVVHNLIVADSLFDGCFTGFAMRPDGLSGAQNGTAPATFQVTNTLMHVQPQLLGSTYCSAAWEPYRCKPTGTPGVWLGAHGIWKWSTAAPATVIVRDSIFRLDQPGLSSCRAFQWPAGSYSNVTVVWTGAEPYATAGGCTNVVPAGVTVTTDVSVWQNAVAAWLAGTPTATPTPTPTVTPTTATPTPTPTPTKPTLTATATPTKTRGPKRRTSLCAQGWLRFLMRSAC
jgi:hypothetical protein